MEMTNKPIHASTIAPKPRCGDGYVQEQLKPVMTAMRLRRIRVYRIAQPLHAAMVLYKPVWRRVTTTTKCRLMNVSMIVPLLRVGTVISERDSKPATITIKYRLTLVSMIAVSPRAVTVMCTRVLRNATITIESTTMCATTAVKAL